MSKVLSGSKFLPNSSLLTLRRVEQTDSTWTVEADGPDRAVCPGCRRVSRSRHSSYWRTLNDLPSLGATVVLRVRVGRWRCRNGNCAIKIFRTELPGVTTAYSRQTSRVRAIVSVVGHALGGRPAETLMNRLGMRISDDTILRQVKQQQANRRGQGEVRVVGIDDWARHKGQTYGTIFVDLERHEVIDLLHERTTEAVTDWLAAHPGIETICRDRNGGYARAARHVAPQATQVADRFHLVQNLRETVERELAVRRRHLAVTLPAQSAPTAVALPVEEKKDVKSRTSAPSEVVIRGDEVTRQRREQKETLFARVQAMKAEGLKVSQMAPQLGINRRRIDKWVKLTELPERSRMEARPGTAESFREYLHQRWEAGFRNGRRLMAEIRELGYVGGYSRLAEILSPWRREPEVGVGGVPDTLPVELVGMIEDAEHREPVVAVLQPTRQRQISPQVAAALLSRDRS